MSRTRLCVLLLACAASPALGISIGQVDDFEGGGTLGWGGGSQTLSTPADGGPGGAGDAYMAYTSIGFSGANSRMVIPNEGDGNQWAGDYVAAGVTGIELDVLNSGATDLSLRLAFSNGMTWYASTDPVLVTAGSDWSRITLNIDEGIMTKVGSGDDSFAEVMSNVTRTRLLSSVGVPPVSFGGTGAAQGDPIAASIGIDNIRALGVPEPSALLAAGALLIGASVRRRAIR